ncbi:acyl-CoA dehydrogenase family protein [Spongisporangium articulatum]|uniref:Acyl-CoA dehydrogenase family protein n=1 Tax=Spongisporangium articulatum TaxID=3362603 RepID=A0ABW8AKH1_9ACTN
MERHVYNEDHEALRLVAREFVDRHVRPNEEQFIADKAIPREVWLEAGKQGLLGLQVPEEFGGAGVDDWRFSAVVTEELAGFSVALGSCWGINSDINAPYLVGLTNDEQKARWLPKYATGELWTAIGMTEPGGGSDLAALKTTAVRDGDDWILNGSKTFITNGYSADLVIVAARTDPSKGAKGISLFGVEAGMAGFSRGRKLDKVGQPESDTAELFFENVRVPNANLIGTENLGFIHMMKHLAQERIGSAVCNIALATSILKETIEYTKERKAFGAPIGTFQHNKFKLAELTAKVEVTQAFVDQAITAHAEHKLSAVDAAKAKLITASIQGEVLDACVQLFGGYGYMNEYRVARAWKDARVTRIWAGSEEIMKELIGRDLGL